MYFTTFFDLDIYFPWNKLTVLALYKKHYFDFFKKNAAMPYMFFTAL